MKPEPTPEIKPDETTEVDDHPLIARRADKVARLRAAGVEPYPVGYTRDAAAADLHRQFGGLEADSRTGVTVTVAGRLMNTRQLGRLIFGVLQDYSGQIQLFAASGSLGKEKLADFEELDQGDWVWVKGEVITTRRGELSVNVGEFALLAKGLRPLPAKWHGLKDTEIRFRRRELDLLVNPEARRIAETRTRVVSELRRQFDIRGFVEVETPVLQVQAGGALARPFETYHNALGLPMFLRIATELHLKRLVVGGMERVFELGRVFRNEGIDARHNPEFTTLEAYQALADYHDLMRLIEEVISAVTQHAAGGAVISYQGRSVDLRPPYRRVPMLELVSDALDRPVRPTTPVEELTIRAQAAGVEVAPGLGFGKLVEEIFDQLVQPGLWDPTFVIDHPLEISPLARRHRSEEGLVERFELFVAGSELVDAFTELNDPVDQRERFEHQAEARATGDQTAHPIDLDFLRALELGMPPTGGLGIGVDRLVMLLTDQKNLREVVLFPHLRPEARSD
ncbi:MAG: lysine--tRNA ligase [bacterium]|nr:lysine--tRNA ligase [bacterium]MCY3579276.1 lysine--tRNA ligase [bacterium]MDE0643847.1 lysine--tRNA ligase [bacterium]MYD03873.1 lysine--tRNA ligase [Acidimicrobiia bacterium]